MGTVVQISISGGGVPKLPVVRAEVSEMGIAGDAHDDMKNHGGPERAVCLFSIERIEALVAEGHRLVPGALGENITVSGVDWDQVTPGSRLRVGSGLLLEVTRYTSPCHKNGRWFADGDFNRVRQELHPGWSRVYARVVQGGTVAAGDPVEIVAG